MKKIELIKRIYEDYELIGDEDIFKLQHGKKVTPIITKTGIQKIAAMEKYSYDFEVVSVGSDYCAVKCTVTKDGSILASSFGSAAKCNVKNPTRYYLEMAEKRAKARAVLIAIGAHGYMYSEDEADEFKQS